jgi:Type I phosphodiesterase / nucleotide pyrophosphatase
MVGTRETSTTYMSNINLIAEKALLERQKLPEAIAKGMYKPSYDGLGLGNIAALALDWLCPEAPKLSDRTALPIFNPELLGVKSVTDAWQDWQQQAPIKHVVLLILDALGYDQLQTLMSEGDTPKLAEACKKKQAFFMPATSVFPTTTVTALTSAATAYAPAQHGLIGTHVYFQEIGGAVNLIGFRPSVSPTSTPYLDNQLNPDTLIPVPNIYLRMEKAGVNVEIINYHYFKNSSISRFTSAGSSAGTDGFVGYLTAPDAFSQLRSRLLLKQFQNHNPSFTYLYIPNIDTLAHRYQPLSPNYRAEVAAIDFSLHRELFAPLTGRSDTVLLLVADHGQIPVSPEKIIWLEKHPMLMENLFLQTGGSRYQYLHIRKGKEIIVADYVRENLAEKILFLWKDKAIALGLLGLSGENISDINDERIGDAILLPKDGWVCFDGEEGKHPVGIHGGLSREEMLIPFLAYRF